MEMKLNTAYKWMAWGTFCTAIHLNLGAMQIVPPYVGFAMVAFGMYGLEKEAREREKNRAGDCTKSREKKPSGDRAGNRAKTAGERKTLSAGRLIWFLRPVMILLVLMSLAGTVIEATGYKGFVPGGIFILILAALEFAGYLGAMSLMRRCGAGVRIWQAAYLIAEAVTIAAGVYGTLASSPFPLVMMALGMMTGRMIFFCCVWGESRKAEV